MSLLRRIRGIIGTGLVWAGAWVVGRLALLAIPLLVRGDPISLWRILPALITSAAASGFVNGVLFSTTFAVANRGRSLSEISPFRTGVVGLVAGSFLPVVQVAALTAIGVTVPISVVAFGVVVGGGLGTATAVGSLKLAQADSRPLLATASDESSLITAGTTSPGESPQGEVR